ncbi:MAG: hypothetical protein JXB04_11470 [Kiritimatiellae bacterium]|nr:hypothetical protein [Kiritimatiellia bacterium]
MSQQPHSSFWIPGGVLLLIFCIVIAPLQSLASRHLHSDSAQSLVSAIAWILRAVAVAGVASIVVGCVLPIFRRSGQTEKDDPESSQN